LFQRYPNSTAPEGFPENYFCPFCRASVKDSSGAGFYYSVYQNEHCRRVTGCISCCRKNPWKISFAEQAKHSANWFNQQSGWQIQPS
jgi:hypothetical protein